MPITVVITGASSGIGEATALAFAKTKCNLVLAARNVENLNLVAQKCKERGANVLVICCDVSKQQECANLINQTVNHFKQLDVLVNNAGISMRALLNEAELSVIERVMAVNFWGAVYCTKFALPYLLQSKGSVISVSSVSGIVGLPARTGYSASKFALDGFMQSLRIETLTQGLHVGIVYPGYTSSNIRNVALNKYGESQKESPLDETKLMRPEKVANTILRMASTRKRQRILTNLGHLAKWLNTFFPSWADKLVYKYVAKEKESPFT